jgi:hypothetical protein
VLPPPASIGAPAPRARWTPVVVLLVVGVVALALRLIGLASVPPGLAHDEARLMLHAHGLGRNGIPLLPETAAPGAWEPLFAGWLWVTGSLGGWSVAAARSATALAGVALALGCVLWYWRLLGLGWALAGGLLVATGFTPLLFSRQMSAGMLGAALLALGLWCLSAGAAAPRPRRRTAWWAGAALCFGLAGYAFAPFVLLLPLVVACGALLLRRRGRGDWRAAGIALALLLALATPHVVDAMSAPAAFWARVSHSPTAWETTGPPDGPRDVPRALGVTLKRVIWSGPEAPRLGSGRALFDPLLALWAVAGLVLLVVGVRNPQVGVALPWLAGCLLLAALVAPGHPEVLLAALPALVLLPLLAARGLLSHLAASAPRRQALALAVVAATFLASGVWSLHDYVRVWARSEAVGSAFNADLRGALAAVERLPDHAEPVYLSTWDAADVLRAFALSRDAAPRYRAVDGRTQVVIPAAGGGYLVYPHATPPDPALLALVTGPDEQPLETGAAPDGDTHWSIWRVAQPARERLPSTVPTIRFPNRIQLVGFAIAPDLGDVATTGRLPDPPRVAVTLVWSIPPGTLPQQVEARLVPVDAPNGPTRATSATTWLVPPGTTSGPGRELVVLRLSVVLPEARDQIVDVHALLLGPDGAPRAPYGPLPQRAGPDAAFLNRIQYRMDTR